MIIRVIYNQYVQLFVYNVVAAVLSFEWHPVIMEFGAVARTASM